MHPLLAALIIAATTVGAIGAMLVGRSFAPPGSLFDDAERASGVFGALRPGDVHGQRGRHHRPEPVLVYTLDRPYGDTGPGIGPTQPS